MTEQDKKLIRLATHNLLGEDQNPQPIFDAMSLLAHWKNKIFVKELYNLLTTEGDIDEQIRMYIKKYESND